MRMHMSTQSHAETLPVAAENLLGLWLDLAFLFPPPFIYEFLFHALGPFQVGLDFLSISSCPCCVYLQLSSMANIKKEDNVPFSCFHPFSSY